MVNLYIFYKFCQAYVSNPDKVKMYIDDIPEENNSNKLHLS